MGLETNLSAVVFALGFVFYAFATFHYHWYHRHSHFYRKRLKELEPENQRLKKIVADQMFEMEIFQETIENKL